MVIDIEKLKVLLWAEAASFRADCADWKRNTEALQDFLGAKTLEEVTLELLAENEQLRAGGQLLVRDRNDLQSERDQLKADNEKMRAFMAEISQSSGDKWAVLVARDFLKVGSRD